MKSFVHVTPQSLPEAIFLLDKWKRQGQVIAGGTDLLLKMKAGVLEPMAVINIKQLPELKGISYEPQSGLKIGALTTVRELTRSAVIREHYPALLQAGSLLASEQIRSLATVGGNLCNAAPSADLAPPLMALGGVAHVVGTAGERLVPLGQFFQGPGRTVMAADELLQAIDLPVPMGTAVYQRYTPRTLMDIAVAGVAVWAEFEADVCRAARIILGAVAPVPLRATDAEALIVGKPLTQSLIEQAAQAAAQECQPIDDIRSSAAYRRRMVAVLVRRGLLQVKGEA